MCGSDGGTAKRHQGRARQLDRRQPRKPQKPHLVLASDMIILHSHAIELRKWQHYSIRAGNSAILQLANTRSAFTLLDCWAALAEVQNRDTKPKKKREKNRGSEEMFDPWLKLGTSRHRFVPEAVSRRPTEPASFWKIVLAHRKLDSVFFFFFLYLVSLQEEL